MDRDYDRNQRVAFEAQVAVREGAHPDFLVGTVAGEAQQAVLDFLIGEACELAVARVRWCSGAR